MSTIAIILVMLIAFALIGGGLYYALVIPQMKKLQSSNDELQKKNENLQSTNEELQIQQNTAYTVMNSSGLSRFMGSADNVQGKEVLFQFLPRNPNSPLVVDGVIQNLVNPVKQGDTFRLGVIGHVVDFTDAYMNVLNNEKIEDKSKLIKVPLNSYTIPNFVEMKSPVDFNYIHSIVITPTKELQVSQFIFETKDIDGYKNNIRVNSIKNQGVNPVNGNTSLNPQLRFCYTPSIGGMSSIYCAGNTPKGSSEIGNCNYTQVYDSDKFCG